MSDEAINKLTEAQEQLVEARAVIMQERNKRAYDATLWRNCMGRLKTAIQHWQGKFNVVKQENNKLRRVLYQRGDIGIEAKQFGQFLLAYTPIGVNRFEMKWWDKAVGGKYYTVGELYQKFMAEKYGIALWGIGEEPKEPEEKIPHLAIKNPDYPGPNQAMSGPGG